MAKMNGYELTRNWFDFCFENQEKIRPTHTALYCFAIEHCNRMGWAKNFGLPTDMTKAAIGIRSYNTYIKTFKDLVEWGFFDLIQKSQNQYSANIIALSKFDKPLDKALDKARVNHLTNHLTNQREYKQTSKPETNKLENGEKSSRFSAPTISEIENYFLEKNLNADLAKKEANKMWHLYESKDWYVGKNKMKKWKSSANGWINRMSNFNNDNNGKSNAKSEPTVNRQTAEVIRSNSQGWGPS